MPSVCQALSGTHDHLVSKLFLFIAPGWLYPSFLYGSKVGNISPLAKFGPLTDFIKFYWNRAMAIDLCIVCACFCTTAAELSSCKTASMAPKV